MRAEALDEDQKNVVKDILQERGERAAHEKRPYWDGRHVLCAHDAMPDEMARCDRTASAVSGN